MKTNSGGQQQSNSMAEGLLSWLHQMLKELPKERIKQRPSSQMHHMKCDLYTNHNRLNQSKIFDNSFEQKTIHKIGDKSNMHSFIFNN